MSISHTLHVKTGSSLHKKLAFVLDRAAKMHKRPVWHYNADTYYIDDVKEIKRSMWLVTFSDII